MARPTRARPTRGQLLLLGVVVVVVVAVVADVLTSLPKNFESGVGEPQAQINGRLTGPVLQVGRRANLTVALIVIGGGAMSPACVAGNLAPALRVVRVTVLGTLSGPWRHGESCAGILEPNAPAPVVITVVPRFAGQYSFHLYPAVRHRRVGSGTSGTVTIHPATG